MERAQIPLAMYAEPGQVVRKQIPGGPTHVILRTEPATDGIRITTNSGSWVFGYEEVVTFPRRADGSVRNWFKKGSTLDIPLARELAVHDILPPDDPSPGSDPIFAKAGVELMDTLTQNWEKAYQVVTAIHAHKVNPQILWWVTLLTPLTGVVRKRLFLTNQPVTFPYLEHPVVDRPATIRVTPPMVKLDAHGPYVRNWRRDPLLVMVAVHPYGRGMWPRVIATHDKIYEPAEMVSIVRPPGHRTEDWQEWAYVGLGSETLGRHPLDRANVTHPDFPVEISDAHAFAYKCWRYDVKYPGDEFGLPV